MKIDKYRDVIVLPREVNVVPVKDHFLAIKEVENRYYDTDLELFDAEQELEKNDLYKKVKELRVKKDLEAKEIQNRLGAIEKLMIDSKTDSIVVGTVELKLKCNKSSQVAIKDASIVPQAYTRTKTEIDKRKALSDLREGIYIEGLELQQTESFKLEIKEKSLIGR